MVHRPFTSVIQECHLFTLDLDSCKDIIPVTLDLLCYHHQHLNQVLRFLLSAAIQLDPLVVWAKSGEHRSHHPVQFNHHPILPLQPVPRLHSAGPVPVFSLLRYHRRQHTARVHLLNHHQEASPGAVHFTITTSPLHQPYLPLLQLQLNVIDKILCDNSRRI